LRCVLLEDIFKRHCRVSKPFHYNFILLTIDWYSIYRGSIVSCHTRVHCAPPPPYLSELFLCQLTQQCASRLSSTLSPLSHPCSLCTPTPLSFTLSELFPCQLTQQCASPLSSTLSPLSHPCTVCTHLFISSSTTAHPLSSLTNSTNYILNQVLSN